MKGSPPPTKIIVLGCGASLGVPMAGPVGWGDCNPDNRRNARMRPSVVVKSTTTTILVDCSPDCRRQLLNHDIRAIDAIIFTHSHADHVHGIDDVRGLRMYDDDKLIDAYADPVTHQHIRERFGYAVDTVHMDRGLYHPTLRMHDLTEEMMIGDIFVQSFPQHHGPIVSTGLRFGWFGYSTDISEMQEKGWETLKGVDTWIVDACRVKPHPSHAHLERALEWIERLSPRRAYLTHMNHTMDYDKLCQILPDGVRPAYDGLTLRP
ncbi:MAG: MBL fold metallo-hydrolase [Pseudomonadota bacterium]